jgi:hypothetical protein
MLAPWAAEPGVDAVDKYATWSGWDVPVIVGVAEVGQRFVEVARRLDGHPG